MERQYISESLAETIDFGKKLGMNLRGGEVIELISDLGGGKTALVRGLAEGIGSVDEVSSPSFTINNTYVGAKLTMEHFDFYRLEEPGLLAEELREDMFRDSTVVVVEWGDIVHDVLPDKRIRIAIALLEDESRRFVINIHNDFSYLAEGVC